MYLPASLFPKVISCMPWKSLTCPFSRLSRGVIRGSESMIAVGSTRIEEYDRVVVFALPHAVKEVDRFFK